MGKLFNLESPFWRFVGKLADAVILNILWIIFSIPLVTIGASTTALYYCTMKVASDREGSSLVKDFWKSFKLNFKQATIIWLICVALMAFFGLDIYFYWGMDNQLSSILFMVFIVFAVVLVFTMFYLFPLQAKFYNPIRKTFSFALVMQLRYFHCTLLMAAIAALVGAAVFFYTPVAIFGMGLIAFLQSYVINYVFKKYAPEEDPDEIRENDSAESEEPKHVILNEQTTVAAGAGLLSRENLGSLSGHTENSQTETIPEESVSEENVSEDEPEEANASNAENDVAEVTEA